MPAPPDPAAKKRHLAAAKRWCSRQKAARSRGEKLRCHEQAMRYVYLMLGHIPSGPGPGKLI